MTTTFTYPRLGHSVFCVCGEVVAAGGHTTNFVPTQTAEYYRDGAWHLMQMAERDDSFMEKLKHIRRIAAIF